VKYKIGQKVYTSYNCDDKRIKGEVVVTILLTSGPLKAYVVEYADGIQNILKESDLRGESISQRSERRERELYERLRKKYGDKVHDKPITKSTP
jgi:hypothetical protein